MCRWFPCRWIPCRWFPCMWIRGKSGIFRKNRGETPKSLILLAFSSALPGLARGPELSPLEGPRDQAPGQAPRSRPSRRPQNARMRGDTLAPVHTYCPRPSRLALAAEGLELARPPGPRAPELAPGAHQVSPRARTRHAPGKPPGLAQARAPRPNRWAREGPRLAPGGAIRQARESPAPWSRIRHARPQSKSPGQCRGLSFNA